jgi:hypothetical protein
VGVFPQACAIMAESLEGVNGRVRGLAREELRPAHRYHGPHHRHIVCPQGRRPMEDIGRSAIFCSVEG